MSNNETCLKVDHLLADVGRVIGDALNGLGNPEQSKRECNRDGSVLDIGLCGSKKFALELCDGVVEKKDLLREIGIAGRERTIRVSEHADDAVGHDAEDSWDTHGGGLVLQYMFRDLYSAIRDALKLVVHFHNREHGANTEFIIHPDAQEGNRLALDFNINAVDILIASDYR